MTKKRARRGFIILSIVLALGLFLTFCPFYLSYNYSRFNGFFGALKVGTDLTGGTTSLYQCALNEYNDSTNFEVQIDNAVASLQGVLTGMGYKSAVVTKENGDKIRIELANYKDLNSVEDHIGVYSSFFITNQKDFDAKAPSGDYISTKHITSVANSFSGSKNSFNIMLNFNAEGKDLYKKITKAASLETDKDKQKVFVYVLDNEGEVVKGSGGENAMFSLPCDKESEDGFFGFTNPQSKTQNDTDIYALQFITATYGVTFDRLTTEEIAPSLGANAVICLTVALFVSFAVAILLLAYRYGDFGWLAGLSAIFFMIMDMFLLQAISSVIVTMGSLLAIVLTYVLMFDGFVIIFEKIREEYRLGKKLPLAVRGGFKKAFWPVFDTNLVVALFGIVLCFFNAPLFKSVGFIFLVGACLSAFTSLILGKIVCGWYTYLNTKNAKRLNLEKDKTLVIKDEIVVSPSEEEQQ